MSTHERELYSPKTVSLGIDFSILKSVPLIVSKSTLKHQVDIVLIMPVKRSLIRSY